MPSVTQPPRTVSIGGATYDLFVTTNKEPVTEADGREVFELPLGEKIWAKSVFGTYGGGAANTAVGLARLGCSAGYCGILTDDHWGREILHNLVEHRVRTEAATVVENESSSFSIILSSPSGERVILAHQGSSRHLHDVTFDKDAARGVDWVYLNHIHADSCVIEDDLIGILTAADSPRITWNPGGCQIDAGMREKNNRLLVSNADLLLLNKEEAEIFTGKKDPVHALRLLIEAGAGGVCITDGKRGAVASDGKILCHCGIATGPVVDTTGAGDAFGTGMTWGLASGKPLPESLKAGTINAMSVVGAVGAQPGLLTATEMCEKMESIQIDIETVPL